MGSAATAREDPGLSVKSGAADLVVRRAARWVQDGRRLDLQLLADEIGISRVTLFRRSGSREQLLSKALWLLTERTLMWAAQRWEVERPEGGLYTPGTGRLFNAAVVRAPGLRRLLDEEPAAALRVLTDPRGRVQSGTVAFFAALLARDIAQFDLKLLIEPDALAYALVRLGESFVYADVLAGRRPDVDTADRLQLALLEGVGVPRVGRESTSTRRRRPTAAKMDL